ncbi:MAG: rhomboid family intramembrane serine protease [Bacteroidia bacterium]
MTLIIVLITTAVSLLAFRNHRLMDQLIFNPFVTRVRKEWYRFLSCGLLHADFFHLLVNMYVLYSFGQMVESYYGAVFGGKGTFMFVFLYLSSIAAANISTYKKYNTVPSYNALGASGGVSAIVFTAILFDPFQMVMIFPIPIHFPLVLFGVGYLIYSYYMSNRSGSDNINHEAHFYGSLHGIIFTIAFKPEVGKAFISQVINWFS